MDLKEAKQEFDIRTYYWYLSEFEREIAQSFPNLRLCKAGAGWNLFHFMQAMAPGQQRIFAKALCKQGREDLKALGESISEQETELLARYDAFLWEPSSRQAEAQARAQLGEKIKFVSKRRLRKAVVARFIEKYGALCVRMETGDEWDPLFFMEICGWLVLTQFTFGRQQTVLSYSHSIVSKRYRHELERNAGILGAAPDPAPAGPVAQLTPGFAWIQNRWEYILECEVEETSAAVINHCGYFLDVAPKLLRGLEFEKVAPTV